MIPRKRQALYFAGIAVCAAVALLGAMTLYSFGGVVSPVAVTSRPIAGQPVRQDFPPADTDAFQSIAEIGIDPDCAGPLGATFVDVVGRTEVQRDTPAPDPGDSNKWVIRTEIIAMTLTGSDPRLGPISVSESPVSQTVGEIREITPSGSGSFPAESFFDVFVVITIPGETLHNEQPVQMRTVIRDIPPIESEYLSLPTPIPLFNQSGQPVNICIIHVQHVPTVPSKVKIKKEIIRIDTRLGTLGVRECLLTEGATHSGVATFLTLFNPNPVAANVKVFYIFPTGSPQQNDYVVNAQKRRTLSVNAEIAPKQDDVAMHVISDVPIGVERPVYTPSGAHLGHGECI